MVRVTRIAHSSGVRKILDSVTGFTVVNGLIHDSATWIDPTACSKSPILPGRVPPACVTRQLIAATLA